MIKGSTQAFKFTTPYDFNDISNIVAVFSQSYNSGTESAPMPIIKHYNKNVTEIDEWNEANAESGTTYYIGTKYYRYDGAEWLASDTKPTESDLYGGEITEYPIAELQEKCKVYKCESSYYQYNPSTQKWDITKDSPSVEPVALEKPGVDNIPSDANKKVAYKYDHRYYKWNGDKWESSNTLAPIEKIEYWGEKEMEELDTGKIYCALETYYNCIDGEWVTYGRDGAEMQDIYAWNDNDTDNLDKSKIYVLKEFYYEHNDLTDTFDKVAAKEVYYKYCETKFEGWKWITIEDPKSQPVIEAVDAGLWIDGGAYDKNITYVCKNIYYSYNTEKGIWESSDILRLSVVEVGEFDPDNVTYDMGRIYMCPAKYYQYNIDNNCWEEVNEVKQLDIERLSYWSESNSRDKNKVYLCGPTYYQYDSSKSAWQTSNKFSLQIVEMDTYPNELSDKSKVYKCSPTYYVCEDGVWKSYKSPAEVAQNDGFAPIDGDPKSFIVVLTAEETMRFNDKYKGRVQVDVYCGSSDSVAKNKIEYFSVYPTMINNVFNNTSS